MTRTFTTATDEAVVEMIESAQRRLAVIAPGVTIPVARALAGRMTDLPELSLTVILDADAEVYRMGYGEPDALEVIRKASKDSMFDLREQAGIRIGVIIADDRTVVYAPVCRNVEAGSVSPEHPNAVLLDGAATDLLAVASGTSCEPLMPEAGADRKLLSSREIGQNALEPDKVKEMKANLEANPPRPFDLTRRLRVFVSEVQFVDLRLTNAILGQKKIKIPPYFSNFKDEQLLKGIEATLKIPIDFEQKLKVKLERAVKKPYSRKSKNKKPKKFEKKRLSEADLKSARKDIEHKFLHKWHDRGTVILLKDKAAFENEVARLISMTEAYQEALKDQFTQHKAKFRMKIVDGFLDYWLDSPPKDLNEDLKGLNDIMKERICMIDLEKRADAMFDKAVTSKAAESKIIYKGISAEDLGNDVLMMGLRELMQNADVPPKKIEKLFRSDEVVAAQDSII